MGWPDHPRPTLKTTTEIQSFMFYTCEMFSDCNPLPTGMGKGWRLIILKCISRTTVLTFFLPLVALRRQRFSSGSGLALLALDFLGRGFVRPLSEGIAAVLTIQPILQLAYIFLLSATPFLMFLTAERSW